MICPFCGADSLDDLVKRPIQMRMKCFKEQTNEEWLRQCSTEELAEWFAQKDCEDLPAKIPAEIKEVFKNEWLEWLKEKHIE